MAHVVLLLALMLDFVVQTLLISYLSASFFNVFAFECIPPIRLAKQMWTFSLVFQEENLHRCSISADSRIDNSGSEESSDEETLDVKNNGYHDAENEADPETEDEQERALSGKLSESSGYAGSDLYDYKVL